MLRIILELFKQTSEVIFRGISDGVVESFETVYNRHKVTISLDEMDGELIISDAKDD